MKALKTMALLCAVLCSLATVEAKTKKKEVVETVVYKIEEMHCETCEKKIKNCISYEKGMKAVETNLREKTLTLTYDPAKTTTEKLEKRLMKSKYTPVQVKPDAKKK